MSNYPGWILERAFGGTMVADTPGNEPDSHHWPQGRSAPAAAECCDLLVEACNSKEKIEESIIVFLVGGAGNGKSYLANRVTNQISGQREGKPGIFASRTYDYKLKNDGFLRVVNDATIPSSNETQESGYLASDIQTVLDKNGNMLVCVNRGILVSEVNSLITDQDNEPINVPGMLIRWLLYGNHGTTEYKQGNYEMDIGSQVSKSDYYSFCKLRDGDRSLATIHVAFMDCVSLLEPLPKTTSIENGTPMTSLVTEEIGLSPVLEDTRNNDEIPLLHVLKEFLIEVNSSVESLDLPGHELDPFMANLQSLSNESIVTGLSSVLRGMEIITGNHLTYRDAWGIAVLSLLGAMPSTNIEEYGEWVSLTSAEATDNTKSIRDRLTAIIELSLRRSSAALFSGTGPSFLLKNSGKQPAYPPVQAAEAMCAADPLISLNEETSKVVLDKLALLEEEKGPGEALAKEDMRFKAIWTRLDQELEKIIIEWLYTDKEVVKFSERNELLSWYGQYLYRLYALSRGQAAYVEIVNRWQKAWTQAKQPNPRADLQEGLNQLVFTPYEKGKPVTMLPFFSPKVVPVCKGDEALRLVLNVESHDYKWSVRRNGDTILLGLTNRQLGNNRSAELLLDFQLLREILIQSSGSGFTEASNDIEPRIERLRAEVLSMEIKSAAQNNALPETRFVDGDRLIS